MRQYEITPELAQAYVDQVHREVKNFKDKYTKLGEKYPHLWDAPSNEALYNHALSLMNIEYFKLSPEYREAILKIYEQ